MNRNTVIILLVCLSAALYSQKYNFVNWTVEDGLIQSQASAICQDNFRQLWIGTAGGMSRFDGKKFTAYTIQEGLVSNRIISFHCDENNNLWIGTNAGISVFNGRSFRTVKTGTAPTNAVFAISGIRDSVFAVSNYDLYKINGTQATRYLVTGDTAEKITTLYRTPGHALLTHVYQKGIFSFDGRRWRRCGEVDAKKTLVTLKFFVTSARDTLMVTNYGLLKLRQGKVVAFGTEFPQLAGVHVTSIAEDIKHHLWLGSENGVYKLEGKQVFHFNEKSGFTDNSVDDIYKDVENNLWFTTNGDGIFKFRENTFTYYDKSSGLSNTIVMGVTQATDRTIYVGGYGGGLYRIGTKRDLEPVYHDGHVLEGSKINCLYADSKNNTWIGTLYRGVWKYNPSKGAEELRSKNDPTFRIWGTTCFHEDSHGNLFIGTNQGLYLKDRDDSIRTIDIPARLVTSLKQFDRSHVIVGTSKGVFLIDDRYQVTKYHEKEFGDASVLCLAKNGNNLWIGTTDKGVINFEFTKKKLITYNTSNGLPSNFIYSIDVSETNRAWIGTGFGISNLRLDDNGNVLAIKNYGRSDGLLGMECNHNSILRAADSTLWFGTTKGLFQFNPSTNLTEINQPFVILRSVKLFSSLISDSTLYKNAGSWFNTPQLLKLGSRQNHLTFELSAIYFTNPEDVTYRYKLEGIDKGYTNTGNPVILYPSLPPGKYTLKVIGITKSGIRSFNEVSYSFEIEKAFYQTRFFQVFVILMLVGTGALIAFVITRGRQKRKQREKEALERIREEEFMKLRQRTAEDFHDEMGNSLTRISVLTDVLKSKINGKEQEVTRLVQQIKENTTALYNGSRDIIWSLNSQNDGLYEIAEHVKDIGNELFMDTDLEFTFYHNIPSHTPLKLKLDYSRNLTMIFKEAYSNILKHSGARHVDVYMDLQNRDDLDIIIKDNGHGFYPSIIENGNGLKNMKSRTSRMNGEITVSSVPGKGTEISIKLKNIFA